MRGQKMKITSLALAITSAFSLTAFAQSSGSPAKPGDSPQCMEGMVMPGCPQSDKQHQQDKTQSKPPQNAQPQQPEQQNDMPGMQHDMGGMQMSTPQLSQKPDTHSTMTLQSRRIRNIRPDRICLPRSCLRMLRLGLRWRWPILRRLPTRTIQR